MNPIRLTSLQTPHLAGLSHLFLLYFRDMKMFKLSHPVAPKAQASWARYILIALVLEKIVQHLVVTLAFYFNWAEIRSTVAINPSILLVLGAIVAVLFAVSFWGVMRQAKWGLPLVLALALFDIVGEFIAQERIMITFTVSFFVATSLLILALFIVVQN